MKVKKNGIYKTIDPKELGIYLKAGFVEVVNKTSPKFEKVLPETTEVKEEVVEPKAKKKKA